MDRDLDPLAILHQRPGDGHARPPLPHERFSKICVKHGTRPTKVENMVDVCTGASTVIVSSLCWIAQHLIRLRDSQEPSFRLPVTRVLVWMVDQSGTAICLADLSKISVARHAENIVEGLGVKNRGEFSSGGHQCGHRTKADFGHGPRPFASQAVRMQGARGRVKRAKGQLRTSGMT
jgi:hypothetical protein